MQYPNRTPWLLPACVLILITGPGLSAAAQERLAVSPTRVVLKGPRDAVQLVITASNGAARRDVTDAAQIKGDRLVQIAGSLITPWRDGSGSLRISWRDAEIDVPVTVSGMKMPAPPVSFHFDVLPLLSKQGCSSGVCHGSPLGKGGFRLSLRAFDPELDQFTLTREQLGRRINPFDARRSLLLLKPLMRVAHGGGQRLRRGEYAHQQLSDWIAAGAPVDRDQEVVALQLQPSGSLVLEHPHWSQQFRVVAKFADGSTRDVTRLATFSMSDDQTSDAAPRGLVQGRKRGESALIVRYRNIIETATLTFTQQVAGFEWKDQPAANFIDSLVHDKLRQLQYLPSELCTDEEFVRRVYLDVTGLLPTIEQSRTFVTSPAKNKRGALIDKLLASPAHVQFWTLKWGDLLRMSRSQVGPESLQQYHGWLRTAIAENRPYDQFVRDLLLATGSTVSHAPANFYRTEANTDHVVETTAQTFLGVRIQCAKCHNHPFEKWTQENYYGLSAFFHRVQRNKVTKKVKEKDKEREIVIGYDIQVAKDGFVPHPKTGEPIAAWAPIAGEIDIAQTGDPRKRFVDWLTSENNPYLARVEVNRIWAELLGRGIVEPFDDFRESNPAANAPLLDALAKEFISSGFDRRHILRTILNSRTYQRSSHTNEFNRDDSKYFSHYLPRRLSAEQLYDAICQTTGVYDNLAGGSRATQLVAPDLANNDFLKVFGQPARLQACQCERTKDTSLGQALELFNGRVLTAKLQHADNRFRRGLKQNSSVDEIVDSLYHAALSRPPSEVEARVANEYIGQSDDAATALEDLCWAILNKNEFLFQH